LVGRGRANLDVFFDKFCARRADRQFNVGPHYTVADIFTLCVVDFAAFVDIFIPERCTNLKRRHADIQTQPRTAASLLRSEA
jgi:glutathione S-transferase|tara:strand:- start:616 stop:861 length:246 start_codon:yes stop_codon:yes gene_type:complete